MLRTEPLRTHRLVVLGGGRVGKSALAIQFVLGHFVDDVGPVIEDRYRKQCVIDDQVTFLEVLDTVGGQDEFNTAMMEEDMRAAEGFLLVYSVTSRRSFEEIITAYQQILRFKEKDSFSAILIANKCDIVHGREVERHEGRDLAGYLGCTFIETSARKFIRVEQAFANLVHDIRKRESVSQAMRNQPRFSDDRPGGSRHGGCVIDRSALANFPTYHRVLTGRTKSSFPCSLHGVDVNGKSDLAHAANVIYHLIVELLGHRLSKKDDGWDV